MPLRAFVAIAVVAIASFALVVLNMSAQRADSPSAASGEAAPGPGSMPEGPLVAAPTTVDPGVEWAVPGRWTIDLAQGMRLATYVIPPAGNAEAGSCAVYYFGPGQGGGVDANLDRWKGEFQPLEKDEVKKLESRGIDVTRLVARGTYVAHSMRGSEAAGPRPSWALIGAVAQGPHGDLFFKLIGPAATVDAAAAEFDRMLGSLRKK